MTFTIMQTLFIELTNLPQPKKAIVNISFSSLWLEAMYNSSLQFPPSLQSSLLPSVLLTLVRLSWCQLSHNSHNYYQQLSDLFINFLIKCCKCNQVCKKSVRFSLWPSIRSNVISSQVIKLFCVMWLWLTVAFSQTLKIYVEYLEKYPVKEKVWTERSYHDSSIYFHHYSFGIW